MQDGVGGEGLEYKNREFAALHLFTHTIVGKVLEKTNPTAKAKSFSSFYKAQSVSAYGALLWPITLRHGRGLADSTSVTIL